MDIRKDLEAVSQYLQRLMTYGEVFHRNNVKEWSDLCNQQDFDKIYQLSFEDRNPLEKIYSTGRDLAVQMSHKLEAFNDGGILRLIGKWLHGGVDESGDLQYPEKGTPQGAGISPLLSNIFLHTVLDDWFVKEVQPNLKGRSFLVGYADDFIVGCESKLDAHKVLELLKERFNSFSLSLHPEKTKLVAFGKPAKSVVVNKITGTFNFLGFTFYWSKARKGYWVIRKKTIDKRRSRFLKRIWEWCRDNRHENLKEQYEELCVKLRG